MEDCVAKLKRIKIEDLRVGMFIVRLNCSWFRHPFLSEKKLITSEKQIAKLKQYGILEVYINPDRSLDLSLSAPEVVRRSPSPLPDSEDPPRAPSPPAAAAIPPYGSTARWEDRPGGSAAKSRPEAGEISGAVSPVCSRSEIRPGGKIYSSREVPGRAVPFAEEIETARVIQKEARAVIKEVMHDIRLGKSFESERVKRLVNSMVESIFANDAALVSLTRLKGYDEYTYVHSIGVCVLSLTLGRYLNMPRSELELLGTGALLHDVGKTRIPYSILYKPGKLDEKEWEEMKKHPLYGAEILENAKGIPADAREIAAKHHERCNGRGYPYGLSGNDIGLHAQIAGLTDMYDALTRDQIHKEGVPAHDAIKIIYDRCRSEFDSFLVERFIQCLGIYPLGTPVLLDTEEIGIVAGVHHDNLLRPKVLIIFEDSLKKYPEPFLVDLTEKKDSTWYKRNIVMPLNPRQWRLNLEDYVSWISLPKASFEKEAGL